MNKVTGPTLVRFLPAVLLALVVALPLLIMFGSNGATMEEGSLLIGGELVLKGQIPNADFEHLYGPGDLWTLAGAFAVFGVSITVERLVGLLYRILLLWALYRIGKSVSPAVAFGSALLGWILILPFGLIAYSWIAAISFAVAALSVAISETATKRQWFISGLLAGMALLYRADLILVIVVGLGWLAWQSNKEHRVAAIKGLALGVSPYLVHVVTAGPWTVIEGMFIDPVIRLRSGRTLPVPPNWNDSSDFFARLDDLATSANPGFGLGHASQLSLLFWILLIAAVISLVLAWRSKRTALIAFSLFAVASTPQLLQRPSPNHIRFVGVIIFTSLLVTVANHLKNRVSGSVVSIALFVLLVIVAPYHIGRVSADVYWQVFSSDEQLTLEHEGRNIPVEDNLYRQEVQNLFRELDSVAQSGESVFIGPRDLTRTNYSETWLYHLLPQYVPGSYHLEMNPGLANREGGRLAEDIEGTDWVILTSRFDGWNEPNSSVNSGSSASEEVVDNQFCLIYQSTNYSLFESCSS